MVGEWKMVLPVRVICVVITVDAVRVLEMPFQHVLQEHGQYLAKKRKGDRFLPFF